MATVINSYADLQNLLNKVLQQVSTQTGNPEIQDVENASPHGAFWNTMSYDEFMNTNVPGVGVPAVVKGDSKSSNLNQVLRNTSANFNQMPADGPPYLNSDDIDAIAAWIDAGCPNPTNPP